MLNNYEAIIHILYVFNCKLTLMFMNKIFVSTPFLIEIAFKLVKESYDFQRNARDVLRRRSRRIQMREVKNAGERERERKRARGGEGGEDRREEKDEEEQKNLRPCRAAD